MLHPPSKPDGRVERPSAPLWHCGADRVPPRPACPPGARLRGECAPASRVAERAAGCAASIEDPHRHREDRRGRRHSRRSTRQRPHRSACVPTWTRCRCSEENDFALALAPRRAHARLRPRRPHDDAARRRALPRARRAISTAPRTLIFQPGEEGYAGAQGDDRGRPVRALPGRRRSTRMHNWPGLPPARIGVRAGPMMAAADRIDDRRSQGRGGHGAHPHLAIDPVLVAGHIITAAQSHRRRATSARSTAPW